MKRPIAVFALGILLVAVALLGSWQWHARWRFLTRGRPPGFPEPVRDVEGEALCVNAALEQYDAGQRAWALDLIVEGGFDRVRQRFSWAAIEPEPGVFDWEPWDALVADARARDLRLLAVLDGAPSWAGSPPSPEAFARFAAAFAGRYADALTYYQIWHNPNLADAWGGHADAYGYAALLAAAAEAVRGADPDARIVLGSLAPNVETRGPNYAEDVFLEALYIAGAAPHFDVVAVQPYGFDHEPGDRRVARDVLNFSRAILTREVLVAHGDAHKAVWASHLGWNSKPGAWPGPASIWGSVDAATQAAYTTAALGRIEREWPWMGARCLNGFQPRPPAARAVPDAEEHWGFALVGPEGVPRPVYEAVRAWLPASRARGAKPGVMVASTPLARFEGAWTLGPLGADIGSESGDRVTLPFEGTGVALTVRRGPYRAFLFVTVDGEPAPALPRDRQGRAYVVLYDPLAAEATVPLAEHLPFGAHTVEVVTERGWSQWALADWRVAGQPDASGYRLGLALFAAVGLGGAVLAWVAARRVDWGALGLALASAWRRLRAVGQIGLSALLGGLYLLAAWQSLGQGAFRRLGDGGGLVALLLATGLYYLSPWFALALVAGALVSLIVFLRPSLGLMLTMFAAPLYLHPLSLLGKSFSLAELVLLPALAGWAVQVAVAWLRARERPGPSQHRNRDTFWRPVLAFVLVTALSALLAAHRREALRELRLVVMEPALFFAALVTLPMDRRERWRVVDAFVASAVMVAVVGLAQYFLGDVITAERGVRLRSIYGSPNNVGLYLGRVLPLLVAIMLWGGPAARRQGGGGTPRARSWRRLLYAVALLPVGAALLLSLSRGALVLGVPASLVVLGLLAGPRWRRLTLVGIVLGALALLALLQVPRFAALLDLRGKTTGFRVSLWHSAWAMIREHPLLGVGPDNFLYAYRTRYVLPTAWEEFNLSHPHNFVMDFAARVGVVGLAAFVWLQGRFWASALPLCRLEDREQRALALGVMGSMANFLAHGLVDASYFVIDLALVFFLSLAVVAWLGSPDAPAPTSPAPLSTRRPAARHPPRPIGD